MRRSWTEQSNHRRGLAMPALLALLGMTARLALAGEGSPTPGRFMRGEVRSQVLEGKVRVTLHWEPAPGAAEYVVTIRPKSGKPQGPSKQYQADVNRLVVTDLEPERTYHWEVRALAGADQPGILSADGPGKFTTPVILQDDPEVVVPRTAAKVTVDGQVAPGEWDAAKTLNLHRTVFGASTLPLVTPTVRIMYDDEKLYLFCRSCTPGSRAVQAEHRKHDGDVWQDDGFEVFLMPHGSTKYFQFLVNALGSRAETLNRNAEWNGAWNAVAKSYRFRAELVIAAEIAIPWKTLGGRPEPGKEWKFNVVADFSPQAIIRSWAPVNGHNLHDPQSFGTLTLSP